MSNTDNFDRIEQFLFNELSAEEKRQFEENLKNNTSLAEEVALHKLEHKVLHSISDDHLLSEMETWQIHAEEPKVIPIQKNGVRRALYRWSAAASIALLLGFMGWYVYGLNPSANSIALHYFNANVENFVERGLKTDPAEKKSNLLNVQTLIAKGELNKAITKLSPVKKGDADYIYAQFLLGVIYFKQKEYSKAKFTFEATKKLSDPSLNAFSKKAIVQSADWYEVLARLALDSNDPEVPSLLNDIASNPNHNQFQAAKSLKADLEKNFRTKHILRNANQ